MGAGKGREEGRTGVYSEERTVENVSRKTFRKAVEKKEIVRLQCK